VVIVDVLPECAKGKWGDVFWDSGRGLDVGDKRGFSTNDGDFVGVVMKLLVEEIEEIDDAEWGASACKASSSCSLSLLIDRWYNEEDIKRSIGSTRDAEDAIAVSIFWSTVCPVMGDDETDATSEVVPGETYSGGCVGEIVDIGL